MAESKRQSTGNRTVTPKPSSKSNSGGPGELDISKAVGARIKLTTSTPSVSLEGTLYAACPITNILAINTVLPSSSSASNPQGQPGDYHLIPISRVQSFSVVSLSESTTRNENATLGFESASPSINRIDLKAMKAREEATIRQIKEKDAMRGKGVTKEAQEIFDAIARTLPARWHETSIIVNESVIVASPYRPEDCTAPKDQHNSLTRVKKVLENERRKISEKANSSKGASGATAPAVPRKGG